MIYLAQTDTTAGFLSKDLKKINALKNRDENQPCLITTAKFSELKTLARIPNAFKNYVRRAKKTTFIYANRKAIRVVRDCKHAEFLRENGYFYSSSANKHGCKFDEKWARSVADIIVDENFFESSPSSIKKFSKKRMFKIR
ncbi:Sua5 YciO YrdC YwlC family protein [Campylobacter canadensis]|uniref:Sua5 YciO YrdC YwlC family protein n=1 Tax=Campylobacter canadensis TaxID=449520 RepID=A0ABS7WT86_9BACT|nr:Sua5 YciO YrdC YwlC family protein [Campylobacter canadensis]MBZ7987259.1 Sua5 YciO YrdC YwlC family protein [Campylobacter canadensis]MBZ7998312.1 Sua5 YciO YrdC YwlC family protein [Campylobacter canadensis]